MAACEEPPQATGLWIEPQHTVLHLPLFLVPEKDPAKIRKLFKVRLRGSGTDILGDLKVSEDVSFVPLIPFTTNSRYECWLGEKKIDSFSIPYNDNATGPKLLAVYPMSGKVPVNLLKIYLAFSEPMRENVSDRYIKLVKGRSDTLHEVFLSLQPELWNEDRTVLTIWLDPGRIKRELQPNQRMGAPLEENNSYTLVVDKNWTSAQSIAIGKNAGATWTTVSRDSLTPDPALWRLQVPKPGTRQPLNIDLTESLDHFLLAESIRVQRSDGKRVAGSLTITDQDSRCQFVPEATWAAGDYELRVDSRLEDLAGNNLNRPFDRDITTTRAKTAKAYYTRSFSIGK